MNLTKTLSVMLSLLLILVWGGCSKKVTKTPPVTQEPTTQAPKVETKAPETIDLEPKEKSLSKVELTFQDVNFDFDKSELRADARDILASHARLLKENPEIKLKIEGHCDERGTVEYNLALGERRASAVKSYLVAYGVDSARLQTIAYGKERPLDKRSNEAAWGKTGARLSSSEINWQQLKFFPRHLLG